MEEIRLYDSMLKEGNKRRKRGRKGGTEERETFLTFECQLNDNRKDNGARKIPIF